jgi:hypothetical protein
MRAIMRILAFGVTLLSVPAISSGQSNATINQNAPIYESNIPAANLAPIYIAPEGTPITVIGQGGQWWQIEFDDPKWGRRKGWVHKGHVTITDPSLRVPQTAPIGPRRPAPRAPTPEFTVRAFADVTFTTFMADQSFEAAMGEASGFIFGGGGEFVAWRRLGVSGRVGRYSKTGERVFIHDGERFGLGIPLRVRITPVMFGADYRVPLERMTPYVGGEVGVYRYDETSSFAEGDENVSESFAAYGVRGGVHFQASRWFGAAMEVRWITVPGALGEGGLSQEFDEEDLGGINVAIRFTVGR